jgi:hypothetical protein
MIPVSGMRLRQSAAKAGTRVALVWMSARVGWDDVGNGLSFQKQQPVQAAELVSGCVQPSKSIERAGNQLHLTLPHLA